MATIQMVNTSIHKLKPQEVSNLSQIRDTLMKLLNTELDDSLGSGEFEMFLKNPLCTSAVRMLPALKEISDLLDLTLGGKIEPYITDQKVWKTEDHLIRLITESFKTLWAMKMIQSSSENHEEEIKSDYKVKARMYKTIRGYKIKGQGIYFTPIEGIRVEDYIEEVLHLLRDMCDWVTVRKINSDTKKDSDMLGIMESSIKNLSLLINDYITDSKRAVKKGASPIAQYPILLLTEQWIEKIGDYEKRGHPYFSTGFEIIDFESPKMVQIKKERGFTTEFTLDIQY